MLENDAYEHAQARFGPSAGVWRAGSDRCIVGRWTPLGELALPRVGEFSVGDRPVVLKTKRQGFVVFGEAATWELAFAAAEKLLKCAAPAVITNGANGAHGATATTAVSIPSVTL